MESSLNIQKCALPLSDIGNNFYDDVPSPPGNYKSKCPSMHNFILNQFEQFASRQFPGMFNRFCRRKEEARMGMLSAEYVMAPNLRYGDLVDELRSNDLLIYLYNYRPSGDVDFGQKICFYSVPYSAPLFKISATTNGRGDFSSVMVNLFMDIETMRCNIIGDFENTSYNKGIFRGRNFRDIQLDFL